MDLALVLDIDECDQMNIYTGNLVTSLSANQVNGVAIDLVG